MRYVHVIYVIIINSISASREMLFLYVDIQYNMFKQLVLFSFFDIFNLTILVKFV